MAKYRFLFCFLFISFNVISQEKFSKEISFITDNDLYVSFNRDRYYTNGMFLNYRYITKNENLKLEKKIFEWEIGHEMFTPNKSIVQTIDEHDRPFAGHLYGSFGVKNVYKNNKILNYTLQVGVIGPNAFGKELQDFIHGIYGFQKATGWQFQIKNAFALNFDVDYIRFLGKNETNTVDFSWVNTARVGTVYTNINAGFYVRFGLNPLEKIINSIAFNTNLNDETTNSKRAKESFFFMKPMLRYAFYDATLQGSFLNETSLVTKDLISVVFNIEIGLKFTANRFNFGYTFNYNTSKSEGLRYSYGNKYGTLNVNYLLP
ncbi:lipid A deacylase LpxR family protein [Polaribacter sp. Hel_I_88]|uniref:lipid A deacylase LpxR family protein n=1 Tax=Polaribacter sp. Hel_I_88 TaxID=1250006 RepID=UPI0005601FF8|nr:lipid A deacylase LpxR family protein [Polaribacter sp. Hel_I_88]